MAVPVIQRPLRGSRIASFYPVKSLPALSSLDSAFQLQEYISLLIRLDVHDVDTIVSIPGKNATKPSAVETKAENGEVEGGEDGKVAEDGDGNTGETRKGEVLVDKACWIYEQLRRLAQDLTHPLITMLQQECTRRTCPEMKAGEWLYLCVAHGTDGAMESCCAIDYILHTLDSATALLNSPRTFPSRLQIPQSSHRHFSSLARRLGRIFAHAYFHHREAFEQAEAESSLYARFLALTSKFELVPVDFLVIPRGFGFGESDNSAAEDTDRTGRDSKPPRMLAASTTNDHPLNAYEPTASHTESDVNVPPASGQPVSGPPGLGIDTVMLLDPTPQPQQIALPESGSESPKKVGRSRTDTMVLSDISFIAEELSKADSTSPSSEGETAASGSSNTTEPTSIIEADNFTILQRGGEPESKPQPTEPPIAEPTTEPPVTEESPPEPTPSVPETSEPSLPEDSAPATIAPISAEPPVATAEPAAPESTEPLPTPSSSTVPADVPLDVDDEVSPLETPTTQEGESHAESEIADTAEISIGIVEIKDEASLKAEEPASEAVPEDKDSRVIESRGAPTEDQASPPASKENEAAMAASGTSTIDATLPLTNTTVDVSPASGTFPPTETEEPIPEFTPAGNVDTTSTSTQEKEVEKADATKDDQSTDHSKETPSTVSPSA
ncbi:hypothetical protein ONZ45_g3302 [Pleurotus djamor]|nr:hypothetical protein ONZ45_g3302 [Pleurotus djamor]